MARTLNITLDLYNENEDIDKAVTEAESVRKKHDAFLQKQVSMTIRR